MRTNFKGHYVARCKIPEGMRAEYIREVRIVFAANMAKARKQMAYDNALRAGSHDGLEFQWNPTNTAILMLQSRRHASVVIAGRAQDAARSEAAALAAA